MNKIIISSGIAGLVAIFAQVAGAQTAPAEAETDIQAWDSANDLCRGVIAPFCRAQLRSVLDTLVRRPIQQAKDDALERELQSYTENAIDPQGKDVQRIA